MQKKTALKFVATELVELSKRDKGCIAYDLFESATVDNHLMICETWETEEDLKAHMESAHFKELARHPGPGSIPGSETPRLRAHLQPVSLRETKLAGSNGNVL